MTMMLEDDFTDIVKKARNGQGLSVAEVAKRSGLDDGTVSDLERGRRAATEKEAKAVAQALGLRESPLADISENGLDLHKRCRNVVGAPSLPCDIGQGAFSQAEGLCQGSILEVNAEVIVNAANSLGLMGGGVAGVIKRAAGAEVEQEARGQAPIQVGTAALTSGGKTKFSGIIHAPTMAQPAMRIPADNVALATRAALALADEKGFTSVAVPGMGTGVGGVAHGEAAERMIAATPPPGSGMSMGMRWATAMYRVRLIHGVE